MSEHQYDFQGFYDKYYEVYRSLTKRVEIFFENKDIDRLFTDDIYNFWGTDEPIEKNKFFRIKHLLFDFVAFVNPPNKDNIDKRIESINQKSLALKVKDSSTVFKNLDEILDSLLEIVLKNNLHNVDATPLQSIVILMWHGYNNEDIISFKISDINSIRINNSYKEILKTYSELKYYRTLMSCKVQNLMNGEYLFRTAHSEQLNSDDIRHIVKKIGSLLKTKGYKFNKYSIEKSRKFELIFAEYGKEINIDIMRRYFDKNMRKDEFEKMLIEYNKWCEL